jgi:hypothetical protein
MCFCSSLRSDSFSSMCSSSHSLIYTQADVFLPSRQCHIQNYVVGITKMLIKIPYFLVNFDVTLASQVFNGTELTPGISSLLLEPCHAYISLQDYSDGCGYPDSCIFYRLNNASAGSDLSLINL